MKIIQVHNYYQQAGGEDAVVAAERALLEENGNVVVPFYRNNEALGDGLWALGIASLKTIWNWQTYAEFRKLLQSEQPDVVHCHNTFPLISPSIYWACAKEKVPVVQTLHNFRMMCATPFLYRQGRICEKCVGKIFPYPAIAYRCYRKSRAGSLVWAFMIFIHRILGTWSNKVSSYIALTEFQQRKMIEGGVPADKIFVKPNFIQTTEYTDDAEEILATKDRIGTQGESDFNDIQRLTRDTPYALFVGRLSDEKGCDVLIRAWALYQKELQAGGFELSTNDPPRLIIVGDGPERATLENLSSDLCSPTSVHFLGKQPKDEVLSLMRDAQFLVFPSVWYETFGLTVFEAGLVKTPAIISSPTTTSSLISKDVTGIVFPMGDVDNLAEKLLWAFGHPEEMQLMGGNAFDAFSKKFSAESNYLELMDIYESVLRVKC